MSQTPIGEQGSEATRVEGAVEDPCGDWAALREADGISDTGAVLVRPDHHVCRRVPVAPPDQGVALAAAMTAVLARS